MNREPVRGESWTGSSHNCKLQTSEAKASSVSFRVFWEWLPAEQQSDSVHNNTEEAEASFKQSRKHL